MAESLPTFQELLQAQLAAQGKPAQAALQGVNQGVALGRSILERNQDQEELKRQFQLKVQQALLDKRKTEAGFLTPGDTAETIGQRERTPEVQAALTPKPKEPKLGRSVQQTADEIVTI